MRLVTFSEYEAEWESEPSVAVTMTEWLPDGVSSVVVRDNDAMHVGLQDGGAKAHAVPAGKFVHAKEIARAVPDARVAETFVETEPPCAVDPEDGSTLRVKSNDGGPGGPATVRTKAIVFERVPFDPRIATTYVPSGVFEEVARKRLVEQGGPHSGGWNVHAVRDGRSVHEYSTFRDEPDLRLAVTVAETESPGATERDSGLIASENSKDAAGADGNRLSVRYVVVPTTTTARTTTTISRTAGGRERSEPPSSLTTLRTVRRHMTRTFRTERLRNRLQS